jgi:hypothetical protein
MKIMHAVTWKEGGRVWAGGGAVSGQGCPEHQWCQTCEGHLKGIVVILGGRAGEHYLS